MEKKCPYETLLYALNHKKAYFNLAKEWHPDKNKNNTATSTFQEINEAYNQILQQDNKYSSILKIIPITLQELYTGTSKKIEYYRNILDNPKKESVQISIPPGTQNDEKIIIHSMGNHKQNNKGDLIIQTSCSPHPTFTRKNNDLHITQTITFKESILGTTIHITKLDGKPLKLKLKGPIQHCKEKIIKDKGMPILNTNKKGNLIIHFQVQYPTTLTKEQQNAIERLF